MVSRQETARPLLTPGEVMQLPPTDEIVMVAGARRYEPRRRDISRPAVSGAHFASPEVAEVAATRSDDWSASSCPPPAFRRQSGRSFLTTARSTIRVAIQPPPRAELARTPGYVYRLDPIPTFPIGSDDDVARQRTRRSLHAP